MTVNQWYRNIRLHIGNLVQIRVELDLEEQRKLPMITTDDFGSNVKEEYIAECTLNSSKGRLRTKWMLH